MAEIRSTKADRAPINGFVLAGGRSRRMGRDKAMLDWHGRPLLDHMLRLLLTAAEHVQVIGPNDLPDRIPGCGPIGGILTALEASDTQKNIIVAVDLPLLTPSFLRMFRRRLSESSKRVLVCKIGSDYPLCIGVDRGVAPAIAERIDAGRLAVRSWIEESDAEILVEEALLKQGVSTSIFRNVNNPEDWKNVLHLPME